MNKKHLTVSTFLNLCKKTMMEANPDSLYVTTKMFCRLMLDTAKILGMQTQRTNLSALIFNETLREIEKQIINCDNGNFLDVQRWVDGIMVQAVLSSMHMEALVHPESWLNIDGCIPAHSVCPFRIICTMRNGCHHLGIDHAKQFSCGSARAYDMTKDKLLK